MPFTISCYIISNAIQRGFERSVFGKNLAQFYGVMLQAV